MIGPNMTICPFTAQYGFNGFLSESSGKDEKTGWLVGYPGEVWFKYISCRVYLSHEWLS